MFSAGLWTCEHQAVIFWAKFPLSYAKVRRWRPVKGDKQVNHITAPSQTTPPPAPPHPSEEFDLTRWDGKHCVTPARGTAKQSTIWFNAYIWTNLFSALFKISTFKIIMCCVDERAGGFALEEGTREDIVKEERKRTKLKRLSRGVWVGDWVRWLKRRYTW